jgi:hypothetical protein
LYSLDAGSKAAGLVLGFSNVETLVLSFIKSSKTFNPRFSPPLTVPVAIIPSSSIVGTPKSLLGPAKLT